MRWSEATQLYLEAKAVDGYSPTTLKGYRLQFALFQRWLGEDPDLDAITTTQLRAYFAKDVGTRKPTTIGHRIRAIHSLWHWCVEEEITDRDPSRRIKEPKAGDRIPKALTIDQLEDLREGCQTPREHALLELFFATGARLAELCQLNWADIQWDRRSIRVVGKGNKERELYWGAKAQRCLRIYLATRTDSDPALFVTLHQPHRRMQPHTIYDAIKQIAACAGMREIVWPHRLRHSLATTLIDNGADLTVVQSILGHSKPSTTLLYTKLSGTRRRYEYDRYFMQ